MKILAIDSSSLVATVAVVEDDIMIAEYTINFKKTHSQTLLPMLDEIKKMTELNLSTLDAIAVAGGPGSFTGLRIGSATAKGLGLALDLPIVNIPTMDAMAYNLYSSEYIICPIMDARREQVYTGIYKFEGAEFEIIEEQSAIAVDELIERLERIGKKVIFVGDGIPVYREKIDTNLKTNHIYAPAHLNRQRAGAVAALALEYVKRGKTETADKHKPNYLRLSQAEREKLERKSQ